MTENHLRKHSVKSVRETAQARMTLQSGKWLRLQKTFRSSDIIARIGGDEFAVLYLETSEESIETIKKRFYKIQADYNQNSMHDFKKRLSIGFASYNSDAPISIDKLLKHADEIMYADKKKLE